MLRPRELLDHLQVGKRHMAILVVTHDEKIFDRMVSLRDGRIEIPEQASANSVRPV